MKKILSLFMALVMLFSITATAFATNTEETYYTVPVQYSDNIGHHEGLRVMVQNDAVYVHAQMFAERLGYTFGETSDGLVIYNKDKTNGLPFGITQFKYNSTQVSRMLFNAMVDTYEAPFAPVKNSEGSWIPLEYAALLLNSSVIIGKDALLIDIPTKKIIDYFLDIARNSGKYNFDWADDFGYAWTDLKVLDKTSHMVNILNGLLAFDGASWATFFQQFVGSTESYEKKYSEKISILLCTESDGELEAVTEDVKLMCDLLDVDSDLGKLLSFTDDMLEFEVGTLQRQCEAALEGLKAGNSTAVSYNRAYQALEAAVDKQTWFSHTGSEILQVQKKMADATGNLFSVLDVCTKMAEAAKYVEEFYNQDEFSLGALQYYLATAGSGVELPNAMKSSMGSYCDALSDTLKEYGVKRFLDDLGQWVTYAVTEQVPLHRILGSQATVALIAWNIASNTIPFFADGLSSTDNFELALYSFVFQADTYLNYLSERDVVFAEDIAQENLYHLAQYCYLYLKSCYITREAALASLAGVSDSTEEKIQPIVDYQNSINADIARMLVKLKQATETTEETKKSSVFGFLPSNNEKYLDEYDGSKLLQWVTEVGESASGGEGVVNLSVSEYQTICSELMATSSAYGSSYEKMAVHMAKIITDAELIEIGDAYRLVDINKEDKQFLAFALARYEYEYSVEYGLTLSGLSNLRPENDYEYYAIYNKEEFKKVLSSLCAVSDTDGITEYLHDLGDNVAICYGAGDPWQYIGGYDIKENDDYILIKAACYYGHNGGAENVYECTANMLFAKAADSVFGLRLVYVEGYNNDLTQNIASIFASSQLSSQDTKTYGASNLIDKKDETAWVEGQEGVGIGETIVIQFKGQTLVQEFGIRNGYQASEEMFHQNGYVTKFSVDFGNGVVKEVVCDYTTYSCAITYFYDGEKSLCKVSLDTPVYTDTIIITILDAEAGSKYSDTCISEIEIY